jgi:hypothetical protein
MHDATRSLWVMDSIAATVSQFLHTAGLGDEKIDEGILCLIDRLKGYRERAKALRPDIFVFRRSDAAAFTAMAGVHQLFEMGEGPYTMSYCVEALKTCAPLAVNGWHMYLSMEQPRMAFGLILRRYTAVAEPPDERLRRYGASAPPFLVLRQIATDVVELICRHARTELHFSAHPLIAVVESVSAVRSKLLAGLTEQCDPAVRGGVQGLLASAIHRVIVAETGFLIGIVESQSAGTEVPVLPHALADGVLFKQQIIPIPLGVTEFAALCRPSADGHMHQDAVAWYAQLQAWSTLIAAMLRADGITLFDNRGRVLGFRVFVRPAAHDGEAAYMSEGDDTSGGARRRAFRAMASLITEGILVGAFYQSKDGESKWVGRPRAAEA